MIVFDTEDDSRECLESGRSGFDKQVTQIAAVTEKGKRFHNAGNVKQFMKWVHRQNDPDLWAFNTQYDIGNLVNAKDYKLPDFDYTLVKGRFIKGQCEGINFFDSHNLSGSGSSVGGLGLAVGLPKFGFKYSEKDFATFPQKEREKYNRFSKMSPEELFRNPDYVARDCEIPMRWLQFVKEQCNDFNIERIPATLGGLCVKVFEALGNENWFCDDATARTGLIGARVELFSGGGSGNLAYTDINSLYPSVMMENFPDSFSEMNKSLDGFGLAEVRIKVPESRLTPLPVKDNEGAMIFPWGTLRGVWTLHEIRNAVANGCKVTKVYWSKGSKDGRAYYRDYVTEIYKRRLSANNPSENLFFKLLLNNLYGRLAIGGEISRTLNLCDENKENGIPFGRKILTDVQMPLPGFTNYLHAAHVLSYARIKLFNYLKIIDPKNLVYCDTDSAIFFNEGNILPFPVSKNLGEMKLEKFGSYCEPYAPKHYRFDDEYKVKGVPKRLAKQFFETGSAEFDLPFKLRESIRFHDAGNSRKLSVWRKVKKIAQTKYSRKQVSGNYFLPKRVEM